MRVTVDTTGRALARLTPIAALGTGIRKDDHVQPRIVWSDAVGEADWIAQRLAGFDLHEVTSVVPAGFEAYGRMFHPAEEPGRDDRLVRWADVAEWSGLPLRADSQFHSVALPRDAPRGVAPWSSQGPRQGSLWPVDAEVLVSVLRGSTVTPERCWFCLWDGFGVGQVLYAEGSEAPPALADPVPDTVRLGRRVELPARTYFLLTGPVEAALSTLDIIDDQLPNLWWPADRAWCVGSEIDLSSTYVGGSARLIEQLSTDERLEVLPVEPTEHLTRIEDWVSNWAEATTEKLLSGAEAVVGTPRGAVHAQLDLPRGRRFGRRRYGTLRTQSVGENGISGSSVGRVALRNEEELRHEIHSDVARAIISLVGW
jgi:hypothetical protein